MHNKKNIVLIHGNSSSSDTFKEIEKYIDKEYTITSFDLPGHGNSHYSDNIEDFYFAEYLNKSLSVINQLEGEVVLFGHSLGGHIVIEIAQEIENLSGIIIAGTPPLKKPLNFAEGFNVVDAVQVYFQEHPEEISIIESIDGILVKKDSTELVFDDFNRTNPLVRIALAKNLEKQDVFQNQFQIFKDLDCNKLIVKGEGDILISSDYLQMINNECKSELVTLKDCGHFPQIEQPEELGEILNTFCKFCFNK